MKDVSGATNSESRSSSKGWACFAAVAVGFVFFLSLSAGNKNQTGDPLISGQAKQTVHIDEQSGYSTTPSNAGSANKGSSGSSGGWGWAKTPKDVEKEVEEEVLKAESTFESIISEQLALQQPSIALKMATATDAIRKSLTTLLADSNLLTTEDIDELGNEIESKLNRDVQKYLKEKTTDLLQAEDEQMEIEADLETEDIAAGDGADAKEVIQDLEEEKAKLQQDLRDQIDQVVTDLAEKIQLMAGIIAKEMLEHLLLDKTGTEYKVTLDKKGNLVSFKKKSSSTTSGTDKTSTGKKTNTSTGKTSGTSATKPKSSSSGQTTSKDKTSSSNQKTTSGSSSTQKSSSTAKDTDKTTAKKDDKATAKDTGKPKGKKGKVAADSNGDNDRKV